MSLEWMIYLASVGGSIQAFLIVIFIFLVIFGFVGTPILIMEIGLDSDVLKKLPIKTYFASLIILATVGVLIPPEKTIYSIAAIKMGKELSKNEKVIETSDKVYKLLNQKLDQLLIEKKEK